MLYDVTGDPMNGAVGGAVARRLDEANSLNSLVGGVQAGSLIACMIVYLCWFVRVRANAGVFDPGEQSMKPWWAVVGWFVPFLNLWYPRRITLEVWDASRPSGARGSHLLVNVWWTLWILSLIADRMSAGRDPESFGPDGTRALAQLSLISNTVEIATGVLAILVVLRLTRMQHEKALARAGVPAGV